MSTISSPEYVYFSCSEDEEIKPVKSPRGRKKTTSNNNSKKITGKKTQKINK